MRSGVGSEAENPQNRRKEARSSSASASFTSDKSYQTASSIALNNAGGGHAGSPLAAQEIKLTWRSIAVQSIRFESSSSDERGPASHSDALSAAVFSEIERFRGNSRSDWFYAFLDAFPTPFRRRQVSRKRLLRPLGMSSAAKSAKRRSSWIFTRRPAHQSDCRCRLMRLRSHVSNGRRRRPQPNPTAKRD